MYYLLLLCRPPGHRFCKVHRCEQYHLQHSRLFTKYIYIIHIILHYIYILYYLYYNILPMNRVLNCVYENNNIYYKRWSVGRVRCLYCVVFYTIACRQNVGDTILIH